MRKWLVLVVAVLALTVVGVVYAADAVITECQGSTGNTGLRFTTGDTDMHVRAGQAFTLTRETTISSVQMAIFRDLDAGVDNNRYVFFKIFSAPNTTFNNVEVRPVPASTPVWVGPTVTYGQFSTLIGTGSEGNPINWTTVNVSPLVTLPAGQYVLIAETDTTTGTANMLVLRSIGVDSQANTGFACGGVAVASFKPTPTWVALQSVDLGIRIRGAYTDDDGAAAINDFFASQGQDESGWKMFWTVVLAIGTAVTAIIPFRAPVAIGMVLGFLVLVMSALALFIEGWIIVVLVLFLLLVLLFGFIRGRTATANE